MNWHQILGITVIVIGAIGVCVIAYMKSQTQTKIYDYLIRKKKEEIKAKQHGITE